MFEHEKINPVLHKVDDFQHPVHFSVDSCCKASGIVNLLKSLNSFGHVNIANGHFVRQKDPQRVDGNFEGIPEGLFVEGFGGHAESEFVFRAIEQVGV